MIRRPPAVGRRTVLVLLLIGLTAAKTLAWLWGKPLLAVDHLLGHIQAARMVAGPEDVVRGRLDTRPGEPVPERFVALIV